MNTVKGWFWVGLLCSAAACSSKTLPGSGNSTDYNGYTEDLSVARPNYTPPSVPTKPMGVTPTTPTRRPSGSHVAASEVGSVSKRLDAVLDTLTQKNRQIRYAPGYRIQIYVGNERQAADAAKMQVYQLFPELSPYLTYKQPTYLLKVGDFMRRMDAERYFGQLRQQFSAAILQPDRVDVRRSLLIK